MRTGILVHGCNLGAFQWKRICWGEAPDKLGRITRALSMVIEDIFEPESNVCALVFGTGVVAEPSPRRAGEASETEAFEMRRLMFECLPRLSEFTFFQQRFPQVRDPEFILELERRLREITFLAEDCQNTVEELKNAARIFQQQQISRSVLVSSPVHLPRCLKEACVLLDKGEWSDATHGLFAAPSDTCYQDTDPGDVAIFEPPHRPDRPMFPIQQLVRRITKVNVEQMPGFLKDLDELLEDYDA